MRFKKLLLSLLLTSLSFLLWAQGSNHSLSEKLKLPNGSYSIGELIDKSYKSTQGHVVLRVMPDGDTYSVYVLNHLNTIREITGSYGPYKSK